MTVLRYKNKKFDFRRNFIKFVAFLQRKNVVFVDEDLLLCKKVLEQSTLKGSFIEQLISLPAWSPIFSIESVDGEQWQELSSVFKKIFIQFLKHSEYEKITRQYVNQLIAKCLKENKKIDGKECSILTASIFFQGLFGRDLTESEKALYYEASLQWRKEIAVKEKGCEKYKLQFVNHVSSEIRKTILYDGITKNKINLVSAISQPFLLSPQINFSDILATLFLYLHKNKEVYLLLSSFISEKKNITNFILESIRLAHPFPVLEREITKELLYKNLKLSVGTQVFLMMDQFKHSHEFNIEKWDNSVKSQYAVFAFGAGQRICPGKKVALKMLSIIVEEFVKQVPIKDIVPFQNHHYSGRMNDGKESLRSNLYQLKIFIGIVWKSFKIGLSK